MQKCILCETAPAATSSVQTIIMNGLCNNKKMVFEALFAGVYWGVTVQFIAYQINQIAICIKIAEVRT